MSNNLSPWPRVRFLDSNGNPLSGGKMYTYLTGTSTPKTSYSDSAGTPNANPVILDSEGYADIWLDGTVEYRFRLESSAGVLQWQRDKIKGSDSTTAVVNTMTEMLAITNPTATPVCVLTGYYAAGDNGGGVFVWDAASTEADNGGTIVKLSSVATGRYKRLHNGAKNTLWFGCKQDGFTDDTTTFNNALASGGEIITTSGTMMIDSATMSVAGTSYRCDGGAVIKLKTPGTLNAIGLDVTANYCTVDIYKADANSTSRTFCRVTGSYCNVTIKNAINGTADASSTTSVSALEVTGNNVTFDVSAYNWANTGQSNGSVPRVVTVQGTADQWAGRIAGETLRAGLVIGSSTGTGSCDTVNVKSCLDNGVYQLGGKCTIGEVTYSGSEEPVVIKGTCTIDTVNVIGTATTGVSFDDAVRASIGTINLIPGSSDTVCAASAIQLRNTNTASGRISIGRIVGRLSGDNLMRLADGTCSYLTIGSIDLDYVYDPATSGTISQFANISGCNGFSLTGANIRIIDSTSALTNTDVFRFTPPTTNLTKTSFWAANRVTVLQSNEVSASNALFRAGSMAQTLIKVSDAAWQDVAGTMYIRDTAYLSGATNAFDTAAPTGGTWVAGADYILVGAAAAPFRVRCTVAGTPGTWVTY